jgi:hypothetical protein
MSFELAVLCVGFVVTGHVVAGLRRGNVRNHFVGASQIDVVTQATAQAAFEAIRHIGAPFRVDDADAESRRLVLSSSPTVFSYGFLYPIEIEAIEGGSKITIGIMSRFLFGGIIVTQRAHERCVRAIKARFAVPAMRVT